MPPFQMYLSRPAIGALLVYPSPRSSLFSRPLPPVLSPSMEPECNFWGLRIPSGESVEVAPEYKEDFITSVHLTQVALGDKPKPGPHTIFVEKEGEKFALGTLDKDRCTHFSLDIHLATDAIALSHTGKSDVYLTGYEAISIAADEEPGFPGMMPSDDEEGSEEESEGEEDEEAPQGVPMPKGRMMMVDEEAEEGSDDAEDEDGDSDEDGIDGLMHSEEDDSDEEGESGEEEDSDEEEGSEDESDSDEEEAPQGPPPKAQAGAKRPAAKQPPAATPQPPKKSKGTEGAAKAAPATAPPKVQQPKAAAQQQQQQAAAPAGSNEYVAALKAHLSSKGPTKLAALGSAVKRPAKVPKLKHFLDQHKNVFKYDQGTDTVSLA